MPRIILNEIVNAPPRRAFEAFSDLRNADKNVSAIKKIEILTEGPIGRGTRFRETRIMFKRDCTETMQVTQWNPQAAPPSYGIGGESCGIRFETTFRFYPERSGQATRVELEMTMKAVSLFAKIMSPLSRMMMGSMRKCVSADVADVKRLLERQPA